MSKILRQSIVPIAAVAGAQLISLVTVHATAHSDETGCRPGYYQLGDINRLAERAGRQLRDDARGFPRTDSVSIQTAATPSPVATQPHPAPALVAPVAAAAPAPVANDGGTTQSLWSEQQRLPTKAEEANYQSLRQMGMRSTARPATQSQGENVAL